MIPTSLSDIINHLHDRLDEVPDDKSKGFIEKMMTKLTKYGELLFVTRGQRKYLVSLYGRLNPTEEKPKSGIEELKRRKADLIKKSQYRKKQAQKLNRSVAGGLGLLVKNMEINQEKATMRHHKSYKRQLAKNRLLIKGTKND